MSNTISYSIANNLCILKFDGQIRYSDTIGLEEFITNITEKDASYAFIIDLNYCTFIDSTNLGLLARISNYSFYHKLGKPIIFSTEEELNRVLYSMGFEDAFNILEEKPQLDNLDEIVTKCCSEVEEEELRELILNAHTTLANMNAENQAKFKDVIEYLKNEPS